MREETDRQTAGWGRRFAALAIDWIAANLVTVVILGGADAWQTNPNTGWIALAIFFAEAAVGTALAGGSFGQLALRLRVTRLDGAPLGLIQAIIRTALICLVVPPLVYKPDGRGLHDLAVGSATYPMA
ncbi:hypothetical protein GCM10027425_10880 [Alteromonas gracilis]